MIEVKKNSIIIYPDNENISVMCLELRDLITEKQVLNDMIMIGVLNIKYSNSIISKKN